MNGRPDDVPIIRQARLDELPLLTEIEIDAFATLAAALGDTREPHALPVDLLRRSHGEGLLFVAADAQDRPVGFLAGEEIDGTLYVIELDVSLKWQRQGLGRRLVLAAMAAARANDLSAVTLTTDRHVAFNAPFYGSLGFIVLDAATMPAFLREKLDQEIENGMDSERRVGMACWLDTPQRA